GASPMFSSTTTDPAGRRSLGKLEMKKDLPSIIAAHGVPYVATASPAYLKDLKKKVKKAMSYHGPRYIQIDTPCPTVWGFPPDHTLEVGRLGVKSGLVPLYEMEDGKISSVRKIKKRIPVEKYLKAQKRFRHLFSSEEGLRAVESIQTYADRNIEKFGLLQQVRNKKQEGPGQ
ncbi:MAG: pyruvate ferredoxin oxidoreductase, partial [Deltaproteobacteria bacterium]|nr:pyruvate ferredoxin oxidoreductase [Deltaproteobacteria bacterium]